MGVRDPPGDGARAPAADDVARRELDLALWLIDTLAGEWDPRRYKDTYHDVLMPAKVRSLLSALEASLPERRPGARAAGRRQHRRAA